MQSSFLKEILNDYDKITSKLLDKLTSDSNQNSIEFWREEVLEEKKSIYIIGKTSTGKSTLLNFLLDYDTKKTPLFKTSTKVETGVVQSLEHCESISSAHAIIEFYDTIQFNRNIFPNYCSYLDFTNQLFFPLDTNDKIDYFRNHIIAKKDKDDIINLINTVKNISIKFPLKYFKNYKIIDTPGLGSSKSETDPIVLKNFNGKSFVLWLLDGSKRTLSDDLVLLEQNKSLVQDINKSIHFIVNQFDIADYDCEEPSYEKVFDRKKEMIQKININVFDDLDNSKRSSTYFTSFKNPKKKFAGVNTYQQIEKLEVDLLTQFKDQNFKSVNLLLDLLKNQLKNYSNIINKELEIINKDIKENHTEKTKIEYNLNVSKKVIKETIVYKNSLQNDFIELKNSFRKIDKRSLFYDALKDTNKYIKKHSEKINDSINRIKLEDNFKTYLEKLNTAQKEISISFNNDESFFKKYIYDQELKDNKVLFSNLMDLKLKEFDLIFPILERDISNHFNELTKRNKLFLERNKDKHAQKKSILNQIEKVYYNIDMYSINFLNRVEESIDLWETDNSICKFENFLKLYNLTDNHTRIKNTLSNE